MYLITIKILKLPSQNNPYSTPYLKFFHGGYMLGSLSFVLEPQKIYSAGDPSSVSWDPAFRAVPECEQ